MSQQPTAPGPTKAGPVPAGPLKDGTEVSKWLVANGASEFVGAFYDQGYYDLADVTDAVIDKLVPDTKAGIRAKLKRTIKPAPPPPAAPAIPPLPAGTVLDLTAPTLKAPDGTSFTLPTALSVQATNAAIVSPDQLKTEDWLVIARNSGLVYGLRLDLGDPLAPRAQVISPALEWKVPSDAGYMRCEQLAGGAGSRVVYSDEMDTYVKAGFAKAEASGAYGYCSAAVAASRREKLATAQLRKRLVLTALWDYPRALLNLQLCTQPSAQLVNAVKDALQAADGDVFGALQQVLKDFGHVVPRTVVLGGMLHFEQTEDVEGDFKESDVELAVSAAASAKYNPPATGGGGGGGASAGFTFQTGTGSTQTTHTVSQQIDFTATGGDTTLASTPQAWGGTVKDPKLWAVTSRTNLVSTFDLLTDDNVDDNGNKLKPAVEAAWKAGLAKTWGPTLPPDDATWFERVGVDILISTPGSPAAPVLGGRSTQAHNSDPIDEAADVRAWSPERPTYSGLSALTAPSGHGITWKLTYSGHNEDDGNEQNPLFWVELVEQGWFLAATQSYKTVTYKWDSWNQVDVPTVSDPFWNAALVGAGIQSDPLGAGKVALWTVDFVDPSGYYPELADLYVLKNFDRQLVLGGPLTLGDADRPFTTLIDPNVTDLTEAQLKPCSFALKLPQAA